MTGLECLLKGMPQEVGDGSILLALSAWHLYPDLIVLSTETKKVEFADALFPPEAVLTVGLRQDGVGDDDLGGFRWSLALSHLRYYGDAVKVEVKDINTRVTMRQLHLAILGVLFWHWKIPRCDTLHAAVVIDMLWKTVIEADKLQGFERTSPYSLWFWLQAASQAASELLSTKEEELEASKMLVDFGRRRGRNFLNTGHNNGHEDDAAFFGLLNPHTIAALSAPTDEENLIKYYRSIATTLDLAPEDLLIVYNLRLRKTDWTVFATALPHTRSSRARLEDGTEKRKTSHMRWVLRPDQIEVHPKQDHEKEPSVAFATEKVSLEAIEDLIRWRGNLEALGEEIDISAYNEDQYSPKFNEDRTGAKWSSEIGRQSGYDEEFLITWYAPPTIYVDSSHGTGCVKCKGDPVKAFYHGQKAASTGGISFRLLLGGMDRAGLLVQQATTDLYQYDDYYEGVLEDQDLSTFVFGDEETIKLNKKRFLENPSLSSLRARCLTERVRTVGPQTASEVIMRQGFEPEAVFDFMSYIINNAGETSDQGWLINEDIHQIRHRGVSSRLHASLHAVSFATATYRHFNNASVSLKILNYPIGNANWFKGMETPSSREKSGSAYTLARSFACIAMFESGGLNLDLEDLDRVFAMSSGNSLFVAEIVLCDPAQITPAFGIRRITGSIGRPGVSLLVSPKSPRIKDLSQDFMAIAHADYDVQREDNFRSTTMHLGFSEWQVPLLTGEHGFIDSEVFLVEGVVSIRDRGEHVADIDIVTALRPGCLKVFRQGQSCQNHKRERPKAMHTSLDSWDELLEPPEETVGVFRAHKKWVARLAATCIIQQSMPNVRFVLIGDEPCWLCLDQMTARADTDPVTLLID